jgi:competence protein ComEA
MKFRKNLPFIITMSLFTAACILLTIYATDNEPQYISFTPSEQTRGGGESDESFPLINLNTATAEELQQLPGIGEVRARDIVAHREKIGGFLYLEELMEVSGIGEGTFGRIRDYIYID